MKFVFAEYKLTQLALNIGTNCQKTSQVDYFFAMAKCNRMKVKVDFFILTDYNVG